MPNLAQHQSNNFTKMLLEGDSGSGKTGALTSLVAAGYKLQNVPSDERKDQDMWLVLDLSGNSLAGSQKTYSISGTRPRIYNASAELSFPPDSERI